MIRTPLEYHAPPTVEEASAILADRGDRAAVLGGGTWLVPLMTRGERDVDAVVDLRRLDLAGVEERDGRITIGARATYATLLRSALVRERLPLLHRAASGITGGAQIRNLGTIGGSACHATPTSDVPGCLVALQARMVLRNAGGVRELPAASFFLDAFRTALEPGEILSEIVVTPRPSGVGYHKLKLCESSWPILTAAAVVDGDDAHVTLGGAQGTPLRVALPGARGLAAEEIDALVAERLQDPWADVLAPGSYRRAVAGPVARRALHDAMGETG